MNWIIQLLFGSALKFVAGWFGAREEKAQIARGQAAVVKVAQQQQVIDNTEVRHEVESEVQRLPETPPDRVADAPASSAAGELRNDGWTRD